jgi:hypothetical protein
MRSKVWSPGELIQNSRGVAGQSRTNPNPLVDHDRRLSAVRYGLNADSAAAYWDILRTDNEPLRVSGVVQTVSPDRVVDVVEVVQAAIQSDHLIAGCWCWLTVSVPTLPLGVVADPTRLERVLTNLLANAAKFTDGWHIQLTAEGRPRAGRSPCPRRRAGDRLTSCRASSISFRRATTSMGSELADLGWGWR